MDRRASRDAERHVAVDSPRRRLRWRSASRTDDDRQRSRYGAPPIAFRDVVPARHAGRLGEPADLLRAPPGPGWADVPALRVGYDHDAGRTAAADGRQRLSR